MGQGIPCGAAQCEGVQALVPDHTIVAEVAEEEMSPLHHPLHSEGPEEDGLEQDRQMDEAAPVEAWLEVLGIGPTKAPVGA